MERAQLLAEINYVPVECQPPSPAAMERINMLEAGLRNPRSVPRKDYIGTKFYLQSAFLKNPLLQGWPTPDDEESEIEYCLHETEEDWFLWKQKVDLIRGRRILDLPGGPNGSSPPVSDSECRTPTAEWLPSERSISRSVSLVSDPGFPFGTLISAADWNQDSVAEADSSTPLQALLHDSTSQETRYNPSTPPRQLASPPDSGFQPPSMLPFEAHTPSRTSETSQTHAYLSQQINDSPLNQMARASQQTTDPCGSRSPLLSSQNLFTPPTPLSPLMVSRKSSMSNRLGSPSPSLSSISARAARLKKTPIIVAPDPSNRSTPTNRLRRQSRSKKGNLREEVSSATTYFLYGSQKEGSPEVGPKLEEQVDLYGQELEEEGRRIDKQRSEGLHNDRHTLLEERGFSANDTKRGETTKRDPTTLRVEANIDRWSRGCWDAEEEKEDDTCYVSQEAREISEYIGNDLGDLYRAETYDALGKTSAYLDPYSL
ncbi:hypothetical protein FRC17_007959 [Serendipita sp. 399]|nr:hypothetical protein FRC17_007959 [Serendipita sp. 399]